MITGLVVSLTGEWRGGNYLFSAQRKGIRENLDVNERTKAADNDDFRRKSITSIEESNA